ncbi:hypothetical protein JET89_24015 [Pseudomonas aeruginosa]|uniref:hypothetical protein n=1 Tax=Pseudomonas aeruginosa TaxID=287 RepID=UPI00053DB05C|nr:hypothetical protein [Pseudomonas aeruginosa]AKF96680.1 hypothetical protein YH69_01340 [Pseudomonas aeruginosa]EKN9654592.1 hypothetical protein [Pseudomonas aeruginosa]EKW8035936.1 hypothetical protein [Pseudomonas aeruginosa]KAB0692961.1 hypothetical protein F7O89_19535 [Pseudomonas aeruginosa]KSD78572.1 hypothetical protein AO910_03820 [Pseudomonas aeruginosa]
MIWWEKTVEYNFVARLARMSQQFLAPLDGDHERAGDALLAIASSWTLIEFKKDIDSINQELTKFERYNDAHKALSEIDDHHFFIFGGLDDSGFDLYATTYFSDQYCEVYSIPERGVDFESFKAYIEAFIEYKKPIKRRQGGKRMKAEDYAMVAGINSSNEIIQCLSLSEFNIVFGLDQELNQQQALTFEPGSSL